MLRTTIKFRQITFRINWLITVCVLLLIGGLIRLGVWQLGRAQEKVDLQLAYLAAAEQEATPIDEVPIAGLEFDALQHQSRRVSLQGHYLEDRTIYLLYQSYQDQSGFEIITPFLVDSLGIIVLVSRGWQGIADPAALTAPFPADPGDLVLEGQIFVPEPEQAIRSNNLNQVSWPLQLRFLNPSELAPFFDREVFPYPVRLLDGQPGVLFRHWPAIVVDSGQNFSYALQWFAMALAVAIVSLILSSDVRKSSIVPRIFVE